MSPKLTPTFHDSPQVKVSPDDIKVAMEDMAKTSSEPPAAPAPEGGSFQVGPFSLKQEAGKKKVAILGTAPSSRMLAPFEDKSWQIWSCSPGNMNVVPRWDRWFEIHCNLHWPENQSYGRPYLNWLKSHRTPVYAQAIYACPDGELPNAIAYPKDEMVKEFGPYFFTSSFAWMIALAISEGFEEIALFGVDMASRDEYILQRPGYYFFKTITDAKGIKMWAPYESDIMQPPPLYGFMDSTPFGRKIWARERELKERVAELKGQMLNMDKSCTYLEGALEDLDYIKNIWGGAQQFDRL
jgi:hypothetical protein